MIAQAIRWLFPDIARQELKKFGLLTFIFFLIIGSYWLVGLLKDTLFFKIAFPASLGWPEGYGRLMQPMAKFWSPFIVMVLILVYSKLVDLVHRYQLFYIVCSFYAAIFTAIGGILAVRALYGDIFIGKWLLAATGWLCFFASDSFGSLMVVLFWSFTISITDIQNAKKGFPLIIAGAQLGSIGGSAFTMLAQRIGGIWPLFFVGSFFILCIIFMVAYFVRTIPGIYTTTNNIIPEQDKGFKGFVSGIKLLCTQPYFMGIFVISTFHEVVASIVDYQMRSYVDTYPTFSGELGFAYFQSLFGIAVNVAALFIALFGSRYVLKRYSITTCLLLVPCIFSIGLLILLLLLASGMSTPTFILWTTFTLMIVIKGLAYGFNNPTRDILYIPTSKDAQFKTKGFIDSFGARMMLMGGAQVNNILKYNLHNLMLYGTLLSLGSIGVWLLAAVYVGRKNLQLIRQQKPLQ